MAQARQNIRTLLYMEELSLVQKMKVALAVAPTVFMFGPIPIILASGGFFFKIIDKTIVKK
jgi:hypothetical protein